MFAGSRLLFPIYELCYIGAETREEGGTAVRRSPRCWGIAVLRRFGQHGEAETAVLPEAVVLDDGRSGGRKARCRAPGQGGVAAVREGAEGVGAVRQEAGACCRPPCWGGAGNGDSLPAALKLEEPSPSARRRSVEPSTKGCPVPSHGTASESLSAGWGPSGSVSGNRDEIYLFFFFLSRLCLSSSFRLLFSRLVCPYPQVRHGRRDRLPPERGGGGSRAQSREYPPACEGRWGYVTSGAGPRAVGTERGRWS